MSVAPKRWLACILVLPLLLTACDQSADQARQEKEQRFVAEKAAAQPEPPAPKTQTRKWMAIFRDWGYDDARKEFAKRDNGLDGQLVVELLHAYEKTASWEDRYVALLIVSSLAGKIEIPDLDAHIYDLFMTMDLTDAPTSKPLGGSRRWSPGRGLADLLEILVKAGDNERTLHAFMRVISSGIVKQNAFLERKLKEVIFSNDTLLHASLPMIADKEPPLGIVAMIDFYDQLFIKSKTPDEALAFYGFIASEVVPLAAKRSGPQEDLVALYRKDSGVSYQFHSSQLERFHFRLEEKELPIMTKLIPADGEAKARKDITGKYIVVRHNTSWKNNSAKRDMDYYLDGRLTLLLPAEYQAKSLQEADRAIFIVTSYKHSSNYTDGSKGFAAIDQPYVFDLKTGELLKTLENVSASPPSMLSTVAGALPRSYEADSDYRTLTRRISDYFGYLPQDIGSSQKLKDAGSDRKPKKKP